MTPITVTILLKDSRKTDNGYIWDCFGEPRVAEQQRVTLYVESFDKIQYAFNPYQVQEYWINGKGDFYCQSSIEMEPKCDEQCDHCKAYYKPLEQVPRTL